MKYYKANIKIIEDKKYYGNLPYKYATGYEDEGFAYFQLLDNMQLPLKRNDKSVIEITEQEYKSIIDKLTIAEKLKRETEQKGILKAIESKKQKEKEIKTQFDLLINTLKNKGILTDKEIKDIINT